MQELFTTMQLDQLQSLGHFIQLPCIQRETLMYTRASVYKLETWPCDDQGAMLECSTATTGIVLQTDFHVVALVNLQLDLPLGTIKRMPYPGCAMVTLGHPTMHQLD